MNKFFFNPDGTPVMVEMTQIESKDLLNLRTDNARMREALDRIRAMVQHFGTREAWTREDALATCLDALSTPADDWLAKKIAEARKQGAKWAISEMADYFRELQAFKVAAIVERLAKAIDDGTVDIQ